jgi:hypothetical protein
MKVPKSAGTPVLAFIEGQGCTGKSQWYEVVYYLDNQWRSYAGSSTFTDGEQVIRWGHCHKLLPR